ALSPPQPISVEVSQSPRRLHLTESLTFCWKKLPSPSSRTETPLFATNHKLAAPSILESKHETTTTNIGPQRRNILPYDESEYGSDPSEQPHYLSRSTVSKKIDSIHECSELTTISESLGKSETIQKRKRSMSTVVHSDPDTTYAPNAWVSHNRTVSTIVHYEGSNPDVVYAPQATDSVSSFAIGFSDGFQKIISCFILFFDD
ncbi:hypothetical protein AHF37_09744, partial [Paragonimus kellicotti]